MVSVSVPGRICLLGDKIDLGGMPVIAGAIDLMLKVNLEKNGADSITYYSTNLEREEYYNQKMKLPLKDTPFKYLNAVCMRLEDKLSTGFRAEIDSDIPIGGGLSSSAAVSVGFIKALNEEYNLGLKTDEIAELAYRAEHDDCGIMCGRMDQYSIAHSGVTFIETGEAPVVTQLGVKELPIVIADSQESRQAGTVLNVIKSEYESGNKLVTMGFGSIYECVLLGRNALLNNNYKTLGMCMNIQQEVEESYNRLGIPCATDKVMMMCRTAREAGALGAKQMGAGGGGCMIALAPGRQDEVAFALEEAGGKVYKVNIYHYD